MPIYCKLLKKKDDTNTFENSIPFPPTEDVYQALKEFIKIDAKGLHIAVVCSDIPDGRLNSATFCQKMFEQFGTEFININNTVIIPGNKYYGCVENVDDILTILYRVVDLLSKVCQINDDNFARKVLDHFDSLKDLGEPIQYTPNLATKFSGGIVIACNPSLYFRIIFTLDEKFFPFFLDSANFFPAEIKYVLLGMTSREYALKEEVKAKDKIIEEKDTIIAEKDTIIAHLEAELEEKNDAEKNIIHILQNPVLTNFSILNPSEKERESIGDIVKGMGGKSEDKSNNPSHNTTSKDQLGQEIHEESDYNKSAEQNEKQNMNPTKVDLEKSLEEDRDER